MTKDELRPLIEHGAAAFHLESALIYGIIMTESAGNEFAVRYEPTYCWLYKPAEVRPPLCSLATEIALQRMSYGLMQVMGAVFREYGYSGWLSNVIADPGAQVHFGCPHLRRKLQAYGAEAGISAYNAGHPASANHPYIARVKAHAKDY